MSAARVSLGVLAAGALALTGCGFGLEKLPAPAAISGPSYHLTVQFTDIAALTIGAKVKLQGVVVGDVTGISTRSFVASVGIDVERTFPLPVGSTFQIRFTTPLGEDFVSVTAPPASQGAARLADGAVVPVADTSDAPSIEDTFAALSLVLNGGGLDNLQTIARELGTALRGRSGDARDALVKLRTVVTDLDAHKPDIDKVLDNLGTLSRELAQGDGVITRALAQFPDTIRLLAQDTGQVRALLDGVAALGNTVQDLLARGQSAMLADFDALRPTLDALASRRDDLVPTFTALTRFGALFDRAAPGDYLNLDVTVQLLFDAPPQRPSATVGSAAVSPASANSADAISTLLCGGVR